MDIGTAFLINAADFQAVFRARLRQLLGFYREEVRQWRVGGKPPFARPMLRAYRLCIRTMLGMED
jgi:hypothetical protein